jgi:TolB-like protein/DNA-binding winged helix-turn-helix (wHTH) protein/Tfp pilus assembly protein PilF
MVAMQAYITEQSAIRFGEFELEFKSGELRRDGTPVKLQPQPLKVLALLIANAGQLVTREEIQRAVWAGETFVDFEHGLNFCIKQIRAALGDNAQAPRYIETLPRRGYRFIAPVEKLSATPQLPEGDNHNPEAAPVPVRDTAAALLAATSDASAAINAAQSEAARASDAAKPEAASHRMPQRARLDRRIAALALVAVLVAGAYFAWRRFGLAAHPAKAKVMLAVMPFENLSGDAEQDYFSDGMTEEMIAQLGSLQPARLGVIARTSAMTYKRGDKDVRQIGSELQVDYVLEGSVRREGERVRITAQLIQVSDQTHLWAESYERNQANTLVVQSEVAREIARALRLELLPIEQPESAADTTSAEAHDAYLKGRYLWNKGRPDDVEKSIGQFTRALDLAPKYGAAYAGLADGYIMLGMFYAPPPLEAYPQAKAAARRALELDDRLAEAHTALGTIYFRFDWDWSNAEQEFKRAIALNPSYSRAHHDYGWFLVAQARFDEAIAEMTRARELDPMSPLANTDVGWVYLRARRYDEAIRQMQRTFELEPDFGAARACLERAYRMKGMYKEALDSARKEMTRAGATADELAALDKGDAAEGMRSVTRWRLKRRLEAAKSRNLSPYNIAGFYAELDDRDAAFEWLERAFRERDSELVSLNVDPTFDSLRADARFADLLRRIGLNNQVGRK